jgi:hypothetical protein
MGSGSHTLKGEPKMSNTTATEKVIVLTPYAVHKLVNVRLKEEGLNEVKPQMVYNYVKNNLIPSAHGRITQSDAEAWVEKYVSRKLARQSENAA